MEYTGFLRTICEITQFSVLIPLLIGLIQFYRLDRTFKAVVILFGVSACFGFFSYQLYVKGHNNIHLVHLHTLVEGYMWGGVYFFLLEKNKHRYVLLALMIGLTISFLITTGNFELIHTLSNSNRVVESVLLIYCSTLCFNVILEEDHHLQYNDLFLLNVGVFTYGINNLTFALANIWLQQNFSAPTLEGWALYAVFGIAYYLFISVAIWKHTKVPITAR